MTVDNRPSPAKGRAAFLHEGIGLEGHAAAKLPNALEATVDLGNAALGGIAGDANAHRFGAEAILCQHPSLRHAKQSDANENAIALKADSNLCAGNRGRMAMMLANEHLGSADRHGDDAQLAHATPREETAAPSTGIDGAATPGAWESLAG